MLTTGYYPQQISSNNSNQGVGGKDVIPSSSSSSAASASSHSRTIQSYGYHPGGGGKNVLISASSSRMFSSTVYEISDEINRASIKVLERKYGGRIRAHTAATKIQRAYRRFRLEQQFQHLLKHPGSQSRRRIIQQQQQQHQQPMLAIPDGSSSNNFQHHQMNGGGGGDRQLYTKKLALSQPTLRYQPVVSLRAQLRAEQCSLEDSFSSNNHSSSFQLQNNLGSSSNSSITSPTHSRSPPSPRPMEPLSNSISSNRPYIELMSPRLTQRRVVTINAPSPQQRYISSTSNGGPLPSNYKIMRESEHGDLISIPDITKVPPPPSTSILSNNFRIKQQSLNTDDLIYNNSKSQRNNQKMIPSSNNYPQVVAAGTTPSVWVPRQTTTNNAIDSVPHPPAATDIIHNNIAAVVDSSSSRREPSSSILLHSRPSNNINAAENNGHTVAFYTNSLPRLDRRNHSVGPHISSSNSNSNNNSNNNPDHLNNSPKYTHRVMPSDQQRRRLYRIALNFFNKKPDRGLQLLINWGYVEDDPHAIAKLFIGRRGLSRQMIGEFLGTLHSPFHAAVLEHFVGNIGMYKMETDVAIRHMLTYFRLPGEAQKIDHIVQAFTKRYIACNPDRFPRNVANDLIYILAFAIIMLNTDQHTPSLKDSNRMKREDFIKNLRGVDGNEYLLDALLTEIFEHVKQHEFKTSPDHVSQVLKVEQSLIGKEKPKLVEPHRRLICYCRLHQVPDITRKQSPTVHQREIFLFNDLLIVAKIFSKKKPSTYMLRYWTPLFGLKATTFENQFYSSGIHLLCPDGEELIFNAKNLDDRIRFLADVKESVLESTEMEAIRIELELDKQQASSSCNQQQSIIGSRLARSTTDNQRDSGLPEIDHSSPIATIGASHPFATDSTSSLVNDNTTTTSNSTTTTKPMRNGISLSSGCTGSTTSSASSNGTVAPAIRRLSFNSMDSGMIEEPADLVAN